MSAAKKFGDFLNLYVRKSSSLPFSVMLGGRHLSSLTKTLCVASYDQRDEDQQCPMCVYSMG
jgi:hypothetical protein